MNDALYGKVVFSGDESDKEDEGEELGFCLRLLYLRYI